MYIPSRQGRAVPLAIGLQWEAWQEQQAKVEELQNNINLLNEALDIKEQLNQKLREREDELQKRLYGALKETQYALQYVEGDMRGNHEFLQMAMIRTFKALEQVLKGEG
ncbi:GAT domain-containing protein [Acinetobacter baumannii]|uniref:hypothetical protein n=1 Tax=Acinetobacter baumannii TaxID=470 RepID=UPI00386EFDF6